jgi:hypothetical protein
MDNGEKVMNWRDVLLPCKLAPVGLITYIFHVPGKTNPRDKVIKALEKRGMRWFTFFSENRIVACNIMFDIVRKRNEWKVFFLMDPNEKKAMEAIKFAIELLKDAGMVNDDDEKRVLEDMKRQWEKYAKSWLSLELELSK